MLRLIKALRSFWMFGASVLLTKGMALVTIPLLTSKLQPVEYGQLELVISIVEAFGLVMALGIADSLFRFAHDSQGKPKREVAAGLTGMALTLALVVGITLQVGARLLAPKLGLAAVETPLCIGLAAATLTGLIELPLAWIRLNGRADAFLLVTAARSFAQVATMSVTLRCGYGIVGLLAGNASIDALIAGTLLTLQIRECGIRLDTATFARAGRYGLPLIGASLSTFALGSCDRWFLASAVPAAQLGFYGLAVKLSLIAPLAIQPFNLWWYARRIAVLGRPGGHEASARGVAIGMTLLAGGAAAATIGAPLLVNLVLPPVYSAALAYLPWLVLASALNETCSLTNVGLYAARNGFGVLAVNGIGAVVALTGYAVLTGPYGVWGAIAATIAGHGVRLALYLTLGWRRAPIRYPWNLAAALFALVAGANVALRVAPSQTVAVAAVMWAALAFAALAWRVGAREFGRFFKESAA